MRYYWSQNATRVVNYPGGTIRFERHALTGSGLWHGYYRTSDELEISALTRFCEESRGLCNEITAEEFTAKTGLPIDPSAPAVRKATPKKGSTVIVQLGRFGDIINILPVARHLYETRGYKPSFMVSKEFISILDGVRYVNPVPWEGDFYDLRPAIREAQGKFDEVIVSQIGGVGIQLQQQCDSFAKESWRSSGFLPYWGKLPLVFDNRNAARESKLVADYIGDTKVPVILVNLSGKSSPLSCAKELLEDIQLRWRNYQIVDLAKVKAERIYDLLGLYDRATALVTSDTSTFHLAAASNVKAIKLSVDTPTLWHGAPGGIRYREIMPRREEIHQTLASLVKRSSSIHLYLDHKGTGETARRNKFAEQTRLEHYGETIYPMPVRDEQLPRLFRDGDRKFPYLKDVFDFAASNLKPRERIIFTNTDTCFSPSFPQLIQRTALAFGRRRDFKRLDTQLPAAGISKGEDYCGTDLFIFTPEWWAKHRNEMPDMLVAMEGWDACLRELIMETGGVEVKNAIYHERHASLWENPQNRYTLPGQILNLGLAKKFFIQRNIDPVKHGLK